MLTPVLVLLLTQAPLEGSAQLTEEQTPLPAAVNVAYDSALVSGGRMTLTFVGALLGAAPFVALLAASPRVCGSSDGCGFYLPLAMVALTPAAMGAGGWLAHRIAGGKSHIFFGLGGAGAGLAGALITGFLLHSMIRPENPTINWAIAGAGGTLALIATAAVLEFGHRRRQRTDAENSGSLAIVPVQGGAMIAVGGAI